MFEIILNPDGTVIVPRGIGRDNKLLIDILSNVVDSEKLSNFLSSLSESDVLFGDDFIHSRLCG